MAILVDQYKRTVAGGGESVADDIITYEGQQMKVWQGTMRYCGSNEIPYGAFALDGLMYKPPSDDISHRHEIVTYINNYYESKWPNAKIKYK